MNSPEDIGREAGVDPCGEGDTLSVPRETVGIFRVKSDISAELTASRLGLPRCGWSNYDAIGIAPGD